MVHPGAYRGTKRQKELKRLQKQEEKRQKRLQKKLGLPVEGEYEEVEGPPEGNGTESAEDATDAPEEPGEEPAP